MSLNRERILNEQDGKTLCQYAKRYIHSDEEHENDSELQTQRQWLLENIPFIDTPDAALNEVYYFRWRNLLDNLGKRRSDGKFEFTEGGPGVNYHRYIDCAQGAHIWDIRWLKDKRYLNDYLDITPDYVAYKEWIVHAVWDKYLLDGDMDALARTYATWKSRLEGLAFAFDEEMGLYHVSGGGEGQEFGVNCFDWVEDRSVYEASYTDVNSSLDALHDNRTEGAWWSNYHSPHLLDTITITLPMEGTVFTGVRIWLEDDEMISHLQIHIADQPMRFTARQCDKMWELTFKSTAAQQIQLQIHGNTCVYELIPLYEIEPAYGEEWFAVCGGYESYRVGFNSYTCAGFLALSKMAKLLGYDEEATQYHNRYEQLRQNILGKLWDDEQALFVEVIRDSGKHSVGCELGGYAPWAFDLVPEDGGYNRAWQRLEDFFCSYGLTSLEKNSPHYMQPMNHGCLWNGPVWPLVFTLALKGLANVGEREVQSKWDLFYDLLCRYTQCHYDPDGALMIRENHHPEEPYWIAMAANYNHSCYIDTVLSGLFGILPREAGLCINPHIPSSWHHFTVQDVPYRGHFVSIEFDVDKVQDERYTIFLDEKVVFRSDCVQEYIISLV